MKMGGGGVFPPFSQVFARQIDFPPHYFLPAIFAPSSMLPAKKICNDDRR
jgi:hypothetical protein